ncbi:MAG: hypothetical protein IAE83_00320 [Anaerolinea sp.]|nr:hypothetical protein [Anaerolinea sp.]
MVARRVADLTLDELRELIRSELMELTQSEGEDETDEALIYSDLTDFPIDDLGPWSDQVSLRREDMYNDER